VDLNVVLTKFNRHEISDLLDLALSRGINMKFFEHVEVETLGEVDRGGKMLASPHVPEEEFLQTVKGVVGSDLEFTSTETFGEANIAARVDQSEIRYCRYLCPFELCWVTGTRVDAEGFVYTCMSNRGLDKISTTNAGGSQSLSEASLRASERGCRANLGIV
jgi:GTP 3',8-cyclase